MNFLAYELNFIVQMMILIFQLGPVLLLVTAFLLIGRRFVQSIGQFEKDGQINAANGAVTTWIDFQASCQTVDMQRLTIARINVMLKDGEVRNDESTGVALWNNYTAK